MDNFFDYIIIFIIIISLLNSIFGKKKKQEQQKEEGNVEPASQKKKQDAVDILEQMFGIPTEKKEPEYYGETDNDSQSWDPAAEFGEAEKVPAVETTKKESTRFERMQSAEFTPLDKNKDYSVLETDVKKSTKSNKRKREIISKLRNPKTIRDYILVSEILGKPKAFND